MPVIEDSPINQVKIETERYELAELPAYNFAIARRDFIQGFGGGLLLLAVVANARAQEGQESGGGRRGAARAPDDIGAWLHISEAGEITAFTGKVEVGQDIRTSLAQVVAEELHVPTTSIKMVMGDTDLVPFDMGTFGSLTTRIMSPQLRKVAASAREVLIDLAAEALKEDRSTLSTSGGKITSSKTGKSLSFAELTRGRKLTEKIAAQPVTVPNDKWVTAGKPERKTSARAIVTGRQKYTPDIKVEGMLYGKILRPSAFRGTLNTFDASAAEKIPGVKVIRDGDFAGVAAPTLAAASSALSSIRATWNAPTQPSSKELFDVLRKAPEGRTRGGAGGEGGGGGNPTRGSIEEGLKAASVKLKQTYTVAYIAHAPLEPRAAVAEWKDGKLTVWVGTQRPFGVRSELAGAFRIPESQVRVIMPDMGSGYGGKHTGEVAIEAARLAKAAGAPVKLVWTREEEFTWAYARPAGVIDVASGATSDGLISAWEFHNYNSGTAAIRPMYEIANQRVEFHPSDSPLRQGSYRALAATANHFAREVHIDEIARELKMDPLEFRLKNIKEPRLRAVLERAAESFGWSKYKAQPNRAAGIAVGSEKGGYVANAVEVAVDPATGKIRILRVVTAFECGTIINPDGLKNQVEGAIIQGLGGALFEAMDFADGKVLNPKFSLYRVPRFSDVPPLETILIDRKDLPSAGAGEAPIITIAPALSNAIFSASGIRLRSMPMLRTRTELRKS